MNEAGVKRIRRDSVKTFNKTCEEKPQRRKRRTNFQTFHKIYSPMRELSKPRIVELMQKAIPQGPSGDSEKSKELSKPQKIITPKPQKPQPGLEPGTEAPVVNIPAATEKRENIFTMLINDTLQTSEESL